MATRWDPSSTNYTTQMLQGGQGNWTADQLAQLQQAGVTMGDLQSLNLLGGPEMTTPSQNWSSGGQSGVGGGGTIGGQVVDPASQQRQQQNATLLKLIMAGGGQGKQTGPPAPGNAYGQAYPLYATDAQGNPTGKPVYANPTNQASLLGAAALQMPAVINPPPSGTPSSRSGVAPTSGALIGTSAPQMGWNWDTLANAAGLDSPAIAAYAKAGYTPDTLGKKLGLGSGATPGMAGPWMNAKTGSVFTPVTPTAPTQVTPLTAATQAPAAAYNPTATPFAQAPPAPGLQIPQTPFVAAHTNALADAGQALYAHFGGDPNSASPADIANFHNQLVSATGAGSPMANPLATGAPQPIPSQQAWASQHGLTNPTPGGPMPQPWTGGALPAGAMAPFPGYAPTSGGLNPQPWLGSTRPPPPGMPASPAAALAGLQGAPLKKAAGGIVPGRGNKDTVPALLTPGEYVIPKDQVAQFFGGRTPAKMAGGGSVQDPDPDPNAPPEARRKMLSAQTSQAQPPAAPGGGSSSSYSSLTSGLATAAHAYGNAMANLPKNPIGSGSGVDIRNTRLDPDPDIPYLKAAGMMGGGGGLSSPQAQSALSGVGAGLNQAAQAIASSVKPWQIQQSAIPAPPPAPAAPQFTQPQVAQATQQTVNPYAAYAANQARYPISPYYS